MKLPIYKAESFGKHIEYIMIEIECRGSGTKSDPIIIDNVENLPQIFRLQELKYHIQIVDCDFSKFTLSMIFCENISINNCKFNSFNIASCSEIVINKSWFYKSLVIGRSYNISVKDSDIGLLSLVRCFQNIIENCSINRLKIFNSRGNIFSKNHIPEKYLSERILNPPIQKYGKIFMFLPIMVLAVIGFYMAFSGIYDLLGLTGTIIIGIFVVGIMLIVGFILFFIIRFSIRYMKSKETASFTLEDIKKYPPNIIN